MSVIHGQSHKAIKHFRECPAALATYWIYVSRANHEGVAWPSVRGLKADTYWSNDPTIEARAWLIKHEALEEVKDYVRPQWRKLDEATKARLVNLDKAEYYRPTGILVVGGRKYDLLYFGGSESSEIDEVDDLQYPDVPPRRTSAGSNIDTDEHPPGGTERITSNSEDDTNQSEDIKTLSATSAEGDDTNRLEGDGEQSEPPAPAITPAIAEGSKVADAVEAKASPSGEAAIQSSSPVPQPPSPQKVAKVWQGADEAPAKKPRKKKESGSPYTPAENLAIGDLLKAWMDKSDNYQPYAYKNQTWREQAVHLHRLGITKDHVVSYVSALRQDRFWRDKAIEWAKINSGIVPFLKARNQMPTAPAATGQEEENTTGMYDEPLTPGERIARGIPLPA